MYLKKLHISNFRCFKDYTIEFAPGVTVLFGKNGSGKTTLIHAIHKALSFLMYSEEVKEKASKGKRAKVIDVKTFRLKNPYPKVEGYTYLDCEYEGVKRMDYEININAQAVFGQSFPLEWNMTGVAPMFSLRKNGYRKEFIELYEWMQNEASPQQPLLAFYSDGFPYNTTLNKSKSTEKKKLEFHLKNSFPELGYTDWNSENGFTNVWIKRLGNKLNRLELIPREIIYFTEQYKAGKIERGNYEKYLENSQQELSECENEVEKITACLRKFSEGDKNIEVSMLRLGITNKTEVCIVTSDMERYGLSVLPAGYKRMFYIALDIAYRSILLSNGTSTDIPGVAIIDEIDLHLHPELEQGVLQRFMDTFPSVQFIVSTHSPLVLSGLSTVGERNRVMRMEPRKVDDPEALGQKRPVDMNDLYGLDYNSSVQEGMDVSSGDENLEWGISECAFMIKHGLTEQAEILKNQILDLKLISAAELDKRIKEQTAKLN